MSTIEASRYTPDDLLTMPGGERYELVDGQLVEKAMGAESDWIGNELRALLTLFAKARKRGFSFGPETGYQCFRNAPAKVRKPDASFIDADRLPGNRIPKGHIRIVPDLAVEVISPNDSYYEVDAKVHEYLEAGVRLIWVINPDLRSIKVFASSVGFRQELTGCDVLSGGDVLPGFSCPVASLFPPQEASDAGSAEVAS